MKLVGASTGNNGWFGAGIYFSERAVTALGYNKGKRLIVSVLAVNNVYQCPGPDSEDNPLHGKPCQPGHDAHYSPVRTFCKTNALDCLRNDM